jgi:type II secretory pathway component GspD/PulD (secretin)
MMTQNQKKGLALYKAGDFDKAVEYLEAALKEQPNRPALRTLLFRAKLQSYYFHLAKARRFKDTGERERAIEEYQRAIAIFPGNKKIEDELKNYIEPEIEKPKVYKSYIELPVTLKVDTSEVIDMNLTNTPIKEIFKIIGKSFSINFIFDKDFRDFPYSIEVEKIRFFDILNQLCMVAGVKYRILDPSSLLIYPDTSIKKRNFSLQGVKVFYLSNTKADEAKKLVMTLFRAQQIMVQEDMNLNTLIIKADSNTLSEIERFLYSIDKEKGEIEIDVEILELNRNLLRSIGVDYGDTLATISMGKEADDGTIANSMNVNDLGDTNFYITLPSAALNFLGSDDNTKIISRPNLRGIDGEEIEFMVGDEVPIPQTQFAAAAAGGYQNVPVTQYQYQSVGVDVKITPSIHRNQEVTLDVKLKSNFITGYRGDFPTFGKRELKCIIRLKEGETSIIGGFIKDEMRESLKGMPGISKIPILGRFFGTSSKGSTQSDLVFSITPRVIRRIDITDEDQKAIWSNAQTSQPSAFASPMEPRRPGLGRMPGNSISISPNRRKIPVNSVSYFTLRVNSRTEITSLSIGGSVSGANAEIQELKTDFFGKSDDTSVLKNTSGDSFDIGYTFTARPIRSNVVAQLKIKFLEKGNYTISINSVSAYGKERQQVELTTTSAEIEVY